MERKIRKERNGLKECEVLLGGAAPALISCFVIAVQMAHVPLNER
jgi:hypothetical protein